MRAQLALPGLLVPMALLAQPVQLALRALWAQLVPMAQWVLPAQTALRALWVLQAPLELMDPGRQARPGPLALLEGARMC